MYFILMITVSVSIATTFIECAFIIMVIASFSMSTVIEIGSTRIECSN